MLAVNAGLDQDLNTMQGTPFETLIAQPKTPALSAAIDRGASNVLRLKLMQSPHKRIDIRIGFGMFTNMR